ncbi:interferon-induced protein with tetratricopeptide repeats 1-like [Macrotis lagotis]|uniref:interferon-induced protein with tetratricopeptide repeats 1-like n=1 Tax=Macrotis lagotis TaxID=92651 RepID=UPI003D690C71
MSETSEKNHMMDALLELRCHFTWDLMGVDTDLADLEYRIWEEIEFLDTKFNVGIHNTLAYVKHLKGQNEQALESLRQAEEQIQQLHDDEAEIKSLVTWGNYAWIYYHMDKLAEVQIYLDKIETFCKRHSSPFRYKVELPEIDCEEGWCLLKFGKDCYERARACFQKALESQPENPEFYTGFAIVIYRLDHLGREDGPRISLEALRRAVTINPEDNYLKVLLALKLQNADHIEEGEKYLEEALKNRSSQTYILRYAAKFYRRKQCLDKALQLLESALKTTPSSATLHYEVGLCYKAKMIQIKKVANYARKDTDRQELKRVIEVAITHFNTSIGLRPTFESNYIELGNLYAEVGDIHKAEENYQKVLNMKKLPDYIRQNVHYRYGCFLEFKKRSEADALIQYLAGLKINTDNKFIKNKLLITLEKLVKKHLSQNESDVVNWSLLGFIYKVKGEQREAMQFYEKALELGSTLLLSKTSLFPPDAAQTLSYF